MDGDQPPSLGHDASADPLPAAFPVDRRGSIGASDAAAVIGFDPWRSAADVWLEKTSRVGPIVAPSPAMECGTYVEPALLAWAAVRLGDPIRARQVRVSHPDAPELTATLDAVTTGGALIEAKTAGLVGGGGPHLDAWGDAGTDAVPIHVLIQVQHQLALVGAQAERAGVAPPTVCYVPTLLARRGLVLYAIEPHAGLGRALMDRERQFWRDHVVADVPPPDSLPSLDVLARRTRDAGTVTPLADVTVAAWLAARVRVATAEHDEATARRVLLDELADAESGTCSLGTVSYKQTNRRGYTVAATSYRRLAWSANRDAARRPS
jgi:putative phage-type endonuclease